MARILICTAITFAILTAGIGATLTEAFSHGGGNFDARVTRHEYAIRDIKRLIIRVCAIHQYEDYSARFERDDNTRWLCAEIVSQINK